ncbi:LLM class F420-dependent oxidoreductase [Nocardia sp. NBC_00565]|uniref:LLM class F420-dependent oxidoreductase n=1 Tax=Nocardia sp. NBC_00565 TaxID=2975993 RepID=UPI002E7FC2BF|nr:LLM class F420-dependent oxidoreductase [Nocardia sp. NBC_00565]WUC06783.1 LLM class F420-dependent oxidoreductase [Nocardia sp. NBC_00565]
MRFNLIFPMRAVKHYTRWIGDSSLGEVARLVEDAGFDGIAMSEHPYPDKEWLSTGGHHAFDPFVALSMAAQATSRIRLITYVMVAGYRSPYLGAKAAASLDLLSGGRFTLGIAAGYLKSEFDALGADFTRRGKLLDEAIAAMRATWVGTEHDGPEFGVRDHLSLPLPATEGGPPIWIGGNSKAARRRVTELADGWMPIGQSAEMAAITKTPPLEDIESLAKQIGELNKSRADLDKSAIDVSFVPFEKNLLRTGDSEAFCSALAPKLDDYADAGVSWISVEPASRSFEDFRRDVTVLAERLIQR